MSENLIGDLIDHLKALATACGNRVHLELIPPSREFPCMVLTEVSGVTTFDLGGNDGDPQHRVQLDIYGGTGDQASSLARAIGKVVKDDLESFRGVMGTTKILSLRRDGQRGLPEVDGDKILRRQQVDYIAIISED